MIKLAVIGDPIGHSLSPVVHGAILDQIHVPYEYQKIEVKRGALSQFLEYAKKEALTGFNLTMPHKKDILPYLDEIETEAQRFRAVNTVYQKDGRLLGYNTDAVGYTAALAATGRTFSDKNVVSLGAGGVAGTLLKKAAYDGAASVTVLNRTLSQAEQLCGDAEKETGRAAVPLSMTCDNLERACRTCDILIQATPLGMQGVKADYTDFSFLDALPPDALVSDLIYRPDKTAFLHAAKERRLATMNGLGMLIYQAMLADEIYLERTIDKAAIYPAVCDAVRSMA